MTSGPAAAVAAVLTTVDWLADRGSSVMRTAAVVAWLGATAATFAVFAELGGFGWLLGAICLVPGWVLWRYGNRLGSALDVEKIRSQLGEGAGLSRTRVSEMIGGIQTGRTHKIRGGLQVIKSVRALRSDLGTFGIDVSDITRLANPGSIGLAVAGLFIGLGLWIAAIFGIAFRTVL
jgi:hypothetical protein